MKLRRVILAGGSGFLGNILEKHFLNQGSEVTILTRSPRTEKSKARECFWDARTVGAWTRELDGADVVINLTGRTVNCRYNQKNRRDILESRTASTRVLGEAIDLCAAPPKIWLNASTATIYQHTFGPPWDESGVIAGTAAVNDEFSIEVARAWEEALTKAPTPHTRKIALRAAMVLGHGANSVFPVLRRLARCGLGGSLGDGRQFVSWIHYVDFCRAIEFLIEHSALAGPVNIASPAPLPNREMMSTIRELCRVPIGLPAARWMLEIGAFVLRTETELILKSRRVVPGRLSDAGFVFRFSDFKESVSDLLSNPAHKANPSIRTG